LKLLVKGQNSKALHAYLRITPPVDSGRPHSSKNSAKIRICEAECKVFLKVSWEFGDGSLELGAGSMEMGDGRWKMEDGSLEIGDGSWEMGDGSWELGVRSWELGVRS